MSSENEAEKIIGDVKTGLTNIVHKVEGVFSSSTTAKVLAEAETIGAAVESVFPYVTELASFVAPGSGPLIAAAEAMGVEIENLVTEASNAARSGTLIQLAGNAAKEAITQSLANGGKVTLGSIVLSVPEDVAKVGQSVWDAAAQIAYSLGVVPAKATTTTSPATA
jgi:hypothetical protein